MAKDLHALSRPRYGFRVPYLVMIGTTSPPTTMNSSVVSVKPTDRVKDAWLKMKKNNFSQLPVIDDHGRIAGGITDSLSEDMENVMEKRVQELMGDAFPIVGKDTRLATLVALLKTESAVLVVDKGTLAGIITRYDLMENAYRKTDTIFK